MGRYAHFSDGSCHKFWFAVQSSGEIMAFGGQDPPDIITWSWDESDLPIVEKIIKESIWEVNEISNYSFRQIMSCINTTGTYNLDLGSEKEKILILKLCAKAKLGFVIRRGIKREEYLTVEAEA